MSLRRGQRVGVAVRALRVHVDETHLHCRQRVLELAVAGVALVSEPAVLGTPVDVLVGLPDVLPAAGKAERLEAHRLERDVAGQDHQVSPGELAAVLLLDRPEQPARLVEVPVVRPAVERREALLPGAGAAATVADPVGAGAMPRHPDHERAVVAEVGRPPVLRGGQHLLDVPLDGRQIEGLERLGVIERPAQGIGHGGVLGEDLQVQAVRPPVAVGRALSRVDWGAAAATGQLRLWRSFISPTTASGVSDTGILPESRVCCRKSLLSSSRGTGPSRSPRPRRSRSRCRRTRSGRARLRRRSRHRRPHRTTGTRCGDGCPRPATRNAPPSRRLDSPDQARDGQCAQHVVDRLVGHLD